MTQIAAYMHPPETARQEPDTRRGDYFVSVMDGGRLNLVSGPYRKHAAALADVEQCRRQCEELDPHSVFYAFGTVRLKPKSGRQGILQVKGLREVPS